MDMFATKGLEYILILTYLCMFLLFWKVLKLAGARPPQEQAVKARITDGDRFSRWFHLPDGYHFHRGHSWAFSEGNSLFRVGLSDFAHKLLGRPEAIVLPRIGQRLTQGHSAWALKVDGYLVRQLAPLSGTVVEVNQEVAANPHSLVEDPYQAGWLIKMRADRSQAALKNLLPASLARKWTEESFDRLLNYNQSQLGLVLQDGGVPLDGLARRLAGEDWPEIAREFLLTDEISRSHE